MEAHKLLVHCSISFMDLCEGFFDLYLCIDLKKDDIMCIDMYSLQNHQAR